MPNDAIPDVEVRSSTTPMMPIEDASFRLLVEQVSEYAIFLLSPAGHVASWNQGAQRVKGYSSQEIVGQHFSRFYRTEDRWKCDQLLQTAVRDGRVEDEGWRVRKNGS